MLYILGKLIKNPVKWYCKKIAYHMCYISHVTNITCTIFQVVNQFKIDTMCYIFLESWFKIQFNGHAKDVTCHMCYMSNVTNVTCHKYQVVNKFTIDTMCYIFLEKLCNIHFNVMLKCHTSHVLHDPYHKSIKVIKSLKFNKNKCHMAVGLHWVNVLVPQLMVGVRPSYWEGKNIWPQHHNTVR